MKIENMTTYSQSRPEMRSIAWTFLWDRIAKRILFAAVFLTCMLLIGWLHLSGDSRDA